VNLFLMSLAVLADVGILILDVKKYEFGFKCVICRWPSRLKGNIWYDGRYAAFDV